MEVKIQRRSKIFYYKRILRTGKIMYVNIFFAVGTISV